jgi:hypothetical protein
MVGYPVIMGLALAWCMPLSWIGFARCGRRGTRRERSAEDAVPAAVPIESIDSDVRAQSRASVVYRAAMETNP